jgi:hypothetical protein
MSDYLQIRTIESKRTTRRDKGHDVPQSWQSRTFSRGGNQYKRMEKQPTKKESQRKMKMMNGFNVWTTPLVVQVPDRCT